MQTYLEKEILKKGDLLFAKSLLAEIPGVKENTILLLSACFAAVRLGHLCLKIDKEWLSQTFQDPSFTQAILEASLQIPKGVWDQNLLVFNKGCLYFPCFLNYETTIQTALNALLKAPLDPLSADESLLKEVTPEQKKAIHIASKYPVTLLTGGPGCGKTYSAAKIAQYYYEALPEEKKKTFSLILAAPTGKATDKLRSGFEVFREKNILMKSATLHTLLNIRNGRRTLNPSSYLLASLIIIDECTMIDAGVFSLLLSSIVPGSRLILIGDPNQLPAIGSGSVFCDLVSYTHPQLGLAKLTISQRSDQKEIGELACLFCENTPEKIEELLKKKSSSIKKLNLFSSPNGLKELVELVDPLFPFEVSNLEHLKPLLEAFEKVRILSCMRKGPFGVDAINMYLEHHFRKKVSLPFFIVPILIQENDKELQLSNGQTGIMVENRATSTQLALFLDPKGEKGFKEIPLALLPKWEYAYALSVHKSQGSEYEEVIFLAPPGSEVFGREVLYTGLTRAKKKLYIDIDSEVLKEALSKSLRRYSNLTT